MTTEKRSRQVHSRWTVVAAFTVMAAATQVVWLTYAPVTGVAAHRFGVSESAIGWLATMFPLWYVVLAIPTGRILDRWFKAGLAAGAVLTAGGAVLRLAGASYGWALAGQIVIAIGQPLVLNAISAVSRNYLSEKDRARGIAMSSAGMFGGLVVLFVLGALLPADGQFTLLVGIGSAVACVAALVLLITLRHPVRASSGAIGRRVTVRETLGDPFIRRICLGVFFPFGTFNAITTFAEALLKPAGVHAETASVMLLITVVAGVVSSAFIPVVAARHRRERETMIAALMVATACCLLLAVAPSVPMGFAGLAIIGFVLLAPFPIILELVERRTGESEGTAAGMVMLTGNLGALLVTGTVGLFVHEPTVAFLFCAGVALLGVPVLRGVNKTAGADIRTVQPV
ncbi:MFS transporter [Streptomyces canus]|uniref:MFS transporter n=1 Tax=Streptomyces canus TaxID=58343 RepID=UPI0007486D14|nr:MFS transporter [Streptomyces canus]KUN06946.1 hypothetical protein AQI96_32515 [Streptomyces canus]